MNSFTIFMELFFCLAFGIIMLRSFQTLLCTVQEILKTLNRIETLLMPTESDVSIEFYTTIDGQVKKVTEMNLKVNQNLPVSVQFKDKFGNAAQVDGKPEWSLTAPALANLEVAEDGMSCVVKPVGTVGEFELQCSADADMGEGVKAVLGMLPVTLLPGEAFAVELSAGTPVDQE
jgi:hypothetical protein